MKLLKKTLVTAGLLAALGTASAAPIVFNFETIATGSTTSLSMTQSGLTVTITRVGGSVLSVDSVGGLPATWGSRALSPFLNNAGGMFQLTFSSAISSISIEGGDFQPSDADDFSLTAGSVTDTESQGTNSGFPTFVTLGVSGVNTLTASFSGGSSAFPQSVYWDNLTVELAETGTVPEPGTLALVGAALLAAGALRRKAKAG